MATCLLAPASPSRLQSPGSNRRTIVPHGASAGELLPTRFEAGSCDDRTCHWRRYDSASTRPWTSCRCHRALGRRAALRCKPPARWTDESGGDTAPDASLCDGALIPGMEVKSYRKPRPICVDIQSPTMPSGDGIGNRKSEPTAFTRCGLPKTGQNHRNIR